MRERCEECRYHGPAVIFEQGRGMIVHNWCLVKRKVAPKNVCGSWRPKERKNEDRH
jgi:hypothetical protein